MQPPVRPERAAGPARVVGVQAVGHVQVAGREGADQRPADVGVQLQHRADQRPRLGLDAGVRDGGERRAQALRGGSGGGRLQRRHVLADGRDPVRLGRRLHDQPGRAGAHRQSGRVLQQQCGPAGGTREHAHVGVEHDVPVDVGQQLLGEPAEHRERFLVLRPVRLLGVAERDAAQPVLAEEQRFQHADRDQQAGRAELSHQTAAEGLQMRLGAEIPQ